MANDKIELEALEQQLDDKARQGVAEAVEAIVEAKQRGGKVAVVTGSGPNVHEGVTTLVAELMRVGVVDAVSTSSAVVAHEMGGTLDKVKRVDGAALGLDKKMLPLGDEFELTVMPDEALRNLAREVPLDAGLVEKLEKAPGKTIIKAAGNLGYPMGLWLERLAQEILVLARERGLTFEEVAGLGADPRTMIGIGARKGLPVLVTIPQLVGGGMVGLCIGDSISLLERSMRLARILESADVIVESAVVLTQEVHDGPFETHTGHGLWSAWQGHFAYSLEGKRLVRIDLDPALERVCRIQQEQGAVQDAIADGLPKTKAFNVPFRMEMSGFARHHGSIPIIGDIGAVWPLIARGVAQRLSVDLDFVSWPQQTEKGKQMREWLVQEIRPLDRDRMLTNLSSA